jgi:hypothetical protein
MAPKAETQAAVPLQVLVQRPSWHTPPGQSAGTVQVRTHWW